MDKILNFLTKLVPNNNREWFERHKEEYQVALEEYNTLTQRLIERIALFDSSITGVDAKQSTYRIYRDVRFSPNKDPYKTHMGIYICRGGKKSDYAGYYIHLEPRIEGVTNGSFISAGLFMPTPELLKALRDEIVENGYMMEAAIKKAKGFELNQDDNLKRLPKGYADDSPHQELLKHRRIYVTQPLTSGLLQKNSFDELVSTEFSKCLDLINLLNRSVDLVKG